MYEYIIIGAGVTGITLCKKFREAGISDVLVLEASGRACKALLSEQGILELKITFFSQIFITI